jgi:hypothetical protein
MMVVVAALLLLLLLLEEKKKKTTERWKKVLFATDLAGFPPFVEQEETDNRVLVMLECGDDDDVISINQMDHSLLKKYSKNDHSWFKSSMMGGVGGGGVGGRCGCASITISREKNKK